MSENEIAGYIVQAGYNIHRSLGPGLLESVYEELLSYELSTFDLYFTRQIGLPLIYKGRKMELGFRADIIVENKVIVEIKSVEALAPVHYKQLLTYLKITDIKLGILINFNTAYIKEGIHRVVNNL